MESPGGSTSGRNPAKEVCALPSKTLRCPAVAGVSSPSRLRHSGTAADIRQFVNLPAMRFAPSDDQECARTAAPEGLSIVRLDCPACAAALDLAHPRRRLKPVELRPFRPMPSARITKTLRTPTDHQSARGVASLAGKPTENCGQATREIV